MTLDPATTLVVRFSPKRLLLLVLGGLVFVAVGVVMGVPLAPGIAPGSFEQFVGWVAALFGFAAVAACAVRLAKSGPVVTLSLNGICDTRIAPETIPWDAIEKIGTWSIRGTKILVLQVPDAVWDSLSLTRTARWSRSANRSLGADGFCIATTDLAIKFDDLRAAVIAFADACSHSTPSGVAPGSLAAGWRGPNEV